MKTTMKKLFQQVMEELKNKRTQKTMIWTLGAAVCFLVLIGIFSSLSGQNSNDDAGKTNEEQTSGQTQDEGQDLVTVPMSETFYVDFSQTTENIHLATVKGNNDADEKIEVHVLYDQIDEDLFMYYYKNDLQSVDLFFSYAITLEEGVAYNITVQEQNGALLIEQNDATLCLVAVTPNEKCKWDSITPDCKEFVGEVEQSSEETLEETSESNTDVDETTESMSEEDGSSSEESIDDTNSLEESQSSPALEDDGKVNYKALFRDIVIAALMAGVLTIFVIFLIIAITRKANPLQIIIATIRDDQSASSEYRSWRNRQSEEVTDEDDEYEEEDDDYEEDEVDDEEDDENE